jgi:GNAT superfamily N-acetyltransferase
MNPETSSGRQIGAGRDICGRLEFKTARGLGRVLFILLEYRFFSESEEGGALFFSLPRFLSPLSFVLNVVKSRALSLLRFPCCYVRLATKVVGLFGLQERDESLVVASLAVAKEYRRLGIGNRILDCVETCARKKGKGFLEVHVYTKNVPARMFYSQHGFIFVQSARMANIMEGRKRVEYKLANSG